jgi:hypothetical protein
LQNRKLKNSNREKVLTTIKPANPSTNEEIRKIFLKHKVTDDYTLEWSETEKV